MYIDYSTHEGTHSKSGILTSTCRQGDGVVVCCTPAWHFAIRGSIPCSIQACCIRCKNLALNIRDSSMCLSDETPKAVGPFYLVSMPGEVKYPTQGVNVYPIVGSCLMKANSLNHSSVSHSMGCLEYTKLRTKKVMYLSDTQCSASTQRRTHSIRSGMFFCVTMRRCASSVPRQEMSSPLYWCQSIGGWSTQPTPSLKVRSLSLSLYWCQSTGDWLAQPTPSLKVRTLSLSLYWCPSTGDWLTQPTPSLKVRSLSLSLYCGRNRSRSIAPTRSMSRGGL